MFYKDCSAVGGLHDSVGGLRNVICTRILILIMLHDIIGMYYAWNT